MKRDKHSGVSEQWKASIHRLEDARALLKASRWRGAMYLAGYAVECRLKWKLMSQLRCRNLRELEEELQRRGLSPHPYTHNLDSLLTLARGDQRMRRSGNAWRTFVRVNRWSPAWRYAADLGSRGEAEGFVADVEKVIQWVDHNL